MLDLRYVRTPIVGSALFAAFSVYFGAFAIFFFTALYLDVAQGYSGTELAGMFAPMAVAIVVGGLVAGRWVQRSGSRTPTVVGCLVAAVGMLLARMELNQGSGLTFWSLAVALAVAGFGFGTTVVPLTSAVLTHIPARHSGMAASATNTARQLGAVVGVTALGAIINSHLVDGVLDLPFGSALVPILETGGSSGGVFSLGAIPDSLVTAFLDGLQVALLVAIVLNVAAGLVAALVREPPAVADD
jgi:predicted MFS family arabinose efflux permease